MIVSVLSLGILGSRFVHHRISIRLKWFTLSKVSIPKDTFYLCVGFHDDAKLDLRTT